MPRTVDGLRVCCRCNVDMLKLIQLGLTFTDAEGQLPRYGGELCVWQFNFRCEPDPSPIADPSDVLSQWLQPRDVNKAECLASSQLAFRLRACRSAGNVSSLAKDGRSSGCCSGQP